MLEVRDLSVRFGDRDVLHHLSFVVATGEVLAVQGPSGVGKSTLLRVIAGLLPPDSGAVLVDATCHHGVAEPGTTEVRRTQRGDIERQVRRPIGGRAGRACR